MPRHLILNIERTKRLFPDVPLVLLSNRTNDARSIIKECKVIDWEPPRLEQLKEMDEFKNTNDSFWLHTTSRLFSFCEYHSVTEADSLLHVESDVLLTSDFPFTKFLSSELLHWGKYNQIRDVAALVYSPSRALSSLLQLKMLSELDKNKCHTDMSLLSAVAKDLGGKHAYLPSFNSLESKLINLNSGISNLEIHTNSEAFNFFGGIFDHQTIGMWLDGIDPVHTFGVRKNLFRGTVDTGESFVDPTKVEYHLSEPFKLRINDKGLSYSLFSIHLHSKSSVWFELQNANLIQHLLALVNQKITRTRIDLKVFTNLLVSNLKRGTLLSWFMHAIKKILKSGSK